MNNNKRADKLPRKVKMKRNDNVSNNVTQIEQLSMPIPALSKTVALI